MVCVTEVFDWFKESPAHLRIDFIYNILQFCLPNELRYFTTILEDMNNKDYGMLREIEEQSNLDDEFRQFPHFGLTTEVVHKLCLRLSLLKSTNQKVAQAIYEILRIHFEHANECMSIKNELSNEILLMYAMARFHPAFTFKNKLKLSNCLGILLSNHGKVNDESASKNTNNNCSMSKEDGDEDKDKSYVKITDVSIIKDDAILTFEFNKHNNDKIIYTSSYIEVKNFIFQITKSNSADLVSEMRKAVESLSKNGNFNSNNIKKVLSKALGFLIKNEICFSDDIIRYLDKSAFFDRKELPAEKDNLQTSQKSADTSNNNKVSVIAENTNTISTPIKLKEKKHTSPNRKPVVISVNSTLNQSTIEESNNINSRVNNEENQYFNNNNNNDLSLSSQSLQAYNMAFNQINNNSTSQIISNNEMSQKYYDSAKSQIMSKESPLTTSVISHQNYSMTHSDISNNQRSAFYNNLQAQTQKYNGMCSNNGSSCCVPNGSSQSLTQSLYTTPSLITYGGYPATDTTLTTGYQNSNTNAPNYLFFGYHPYYSYSLLALANQQNSSYLMANQSNLVNDCSNDPTTTNNVTFPHNQTTNNNGTNNNNQIHHSNYNNATTPTNNAPFIGFLTTTIPYFNDQSSTSTINNNQVPITSSISSQSNSANSNDNNGNDNSHCNPIVN